MGKAPSYIRKAWKSIHLCTRMPLRISRKWFRIGVLKKQDRRITGWEYTTSTYIGTKRLRNGMKKPFRYSINSLIKIENPGLIAILEMSKCG